MIKITLQEKESIAIERLRAFEPETEPYYLCYSGGKDSDCIRILAELAGVEFEIHHSLTSVDTPETVRYIKSIQNVIIDIPHDKNGNRVTMWSLIVKKMFPPTRFMRYCCEELKEWAGKGRMKVIGVRADESRNRAENAGVVKILGKPKTTQRLAEEMDVDFDLPKKGGVVLNFDNSNSRRFVEHCYRTTSTMLNPIIDWTESEVWEFLHYYGCEGNPLYKCGWSRIGCIGCPLQSYKNMAKELNMYPKYKQAYIRSFDKMVKARNAAGKVTVNWQNGIDVYKKWIGIDPNQLMLEKHK